MKLKGIPIRVSPTEIIIVVGVAPKNENIYIDCETVEECESLWSLLISLRKGNKIPSMPQCEAFLEKLKRAGVLEEEHKSLNIALINNGSILGEALKEALNNFGIETVNSDVNKSSLRVYTFDYWHPEVLKKLDYESAKKNFEYIPVYFLLDLGIIGPYVRPRETAGYLCFEQQLSSALTWVFRAAKDYIQYIKTSFRHPLVHLRLLAYFAALIISRLAKEGKHILENKAIVIDFDNIFIDVVKVYKTPYCDPLNLLRSEP